MNQGIKKEILITLLLVIISIPASSSALMVEAENFTTKGGWVVDQQFSDIMGSSYLMAHGLGKPVQDAETNIRFPKEGKYKIYVRTYNWTSPWHTGEGPGSFNLLINGISLPTTLGNTGSKWEWQYAGEINITNPDVQLTLRDRTGFNGRCDAIYFTTNPDDTPPSDKKGLTAFRKKHLKHTHKPDKTGKFDLVITGGGIAGMCAAVSAARLGVKVALIQDRPVLGGCNSSEVRVHLGGRINKDPYPNLGNLIKEFGPSRGGNAQPADYYEDTKKAGWIAAEKNITLFTNYRVYHVRKKGNKIKAVIARHIETREELSFESPLFADCTGDGTIGYLAGAGYMMGRESKNMYGEETAPDKADSMTMGSSIQWYSKVSGSPSLFPLFSYGLPFNDESAEKVTMGEWTWETGMNFDQIKDFEYIRDYGLMVVFSNWSFLKNEYKDTDAYKNRELEWVAYIAGKRESRRLIGDYILREQDIRDQIIHDDASVPTTWSIDLHYPDENNSKYFPAMEFKSIARHIDIHPYPIPYRCLYSADIDNLFMAGRNISVTHVALGTVRVMRTTGMMGEVVGMAAALCKKHKATPRAVYQNYLNELKEYMLKGTGKQNLPDNQRYNEGSTLGD